MKSLDVLHIRHITLSHEEAGPAPRVGRGLICMNGTRENLLEHVISWSEMKGSSECIFLVYGSSGHGKTCISATVCERLGERDMLGGAFFIQRDVSAQRDPEHILPSLSNMLRKVHQSYHLQVERYQPPVSTRRLPDRIAYQMRTLFVEPLKRVEQDVNSEQQVALVFVVNGLDHIQDSEARKALMGCLLLLPALVDWLKVFITYSQSRSHLVVDDTLVSVLRSIIINLDDVDVEDDILLYTRTCLEALVKARRLDRIWLRTNCAEQIVEKANGSFLWISTAMEFLFCQRLNGSAVGSVLALQKQEDVDENIDALYTMVLETVRSRLPKRSSWLLKTLLAIVRISSKKRLLNFDAIHDLLQRIPANDWIKVSKNALRGALNNLQPVLYEDASLDSALRVRHFSFLEFLECPARSWDFYLDYVEFAVIESML